MVSPEPRGAGCKWSGFGGLCGPAKIANPAPVRESDVAGPIAVGRGLASFEGAIARRAVQDTGISFAHEIHFPAGGRGVNDRRRAINSGRDWGRKREFRFAEPTESSSGCPTLGHEIRRTSVRRNVPRWFR